MNSMQKRNYFHYFYRKCMKDIANDRLVANEKRKINSIEKHWPSPQNR